MKKTLYILRSGKFRRKDNTLYFEDAEGNRKFIPIEDTNDIFIFQKLI